MPGVVREHEAGHEVRVAAQRAHQLPRLEVVHADGFIRARGREVGLGPVQRHPVQGPVLARGPPQDPRLVLVAGGGEDPHCSVLARGEDLPLTRPECHVVGDGFADDVLGPGQRDAALLVRGDLAADDGAVRAGGHQDVVLAHGQEIHGGDHGAVLVHRRQELEVVVDIEHVDESVAAGAGEEPVAREPQGGDLGVVSLDPAELGVGPGVMDPDVAAAVSTRDVVLVRTDFDTLDPRLGVLPLLLATLLAPEGQDLLQVALEAGVGEGSVVHAPHADRVIVAAGHQAGAGPQAALERVHRPDAGGVEVGGGEDAGVGHVGDVPGDEGVVAVDDAQAAVGLLERHGDNVGDGSDLGSGEAADVLEAGGGEAADDSLGAADQDEVETSAQSGGTEQVQILIPIPG